MTSGTIFTRGFQLGDPNRSMKLLSGVIIVMILKLPQYTTFSFVTAACNYVCGYAFMGEYSNVEFAVQRF